MEDIECVFESVSGTGSLFISNLPAAQNLQILQSNAQYIKVKVLEQSCQLPEAA
jgi:hypothetical protein